ncbi:MAG: M23 family metallopeptidase [Desulfobacterales bacterium]
MRDEQIPLEEARRRVEEFGRILPAAFPAREFDAGLFFPLKGYGPRHVGGKRGEGYRPSRYEFTGPRRRVGHPALDIFVYDGNQDGLDDRTGRPIEVLAFAEGVVVSAFADWAPGFSVNGNGLRGGNYLWLYHPARGLFSYSAHLERLLVQTGERVAGGAVIATLGRSGTNAYAERSPTHLHFMLLRLEDMRPVNPYPLFQTARETR